MTIDYQAKEVKIKELIAKASSARAKAFYQGLLKRAIESRPPVKTEVEEIKSSKQPEELKSEERYLDDFAENRLNLPEIPEYLLSRLSKAYSRYEHFIGIVAGDFDQAEIEEDRQRYPHLLLPEENGLPVFGSRECVEYMHLLSGVAKIYCLVFMCREEGVNFDSMRELRSELEQETKTRREEGIDSLLV